VFFDRGGVLLRNEVFQGPVDDRRGAVGVLEDLARDFARTEPGDLRAADELTERRILRLIEFSVEIGIRVRPASGRVASSS